MPEGDTDRSETVSAQAHERVTRERDEFKAKLAEIEGQNRILGLERPTFQWLASKGYDAEASDQLLSMLRPTLGSIEVDDPGRLPEILEERFGAALPAVGQPPPAEPASDGDSPPPQPVTTPAPSFVTPTPGAGTPATSDDQKIRPGSPEYQELARNPELLKANFERIAWTEGEQFPVRPIR